MMNKERVQVVIWENLAQFFDQVLQLASPVVLVIDKGLARCPGTSQLREDVLSFFDRDDKLFLVYGEEPGCYLARKETLVILLTRVAASAGWGVASFSNCLAFAQSDPFTRGIMTGYNAAGPYPLWWEDRVRTKEDEVEVDASQERMAHATRIYSNEEYGFSIEYPRN